MMPERYGFSIRVRSLSARESPRFAKLVKTVNVQVDWARRAGAVSAVCDCIPPDRTFSKSIDLVRPIPHNNCMLPWTKALWAAHVWMTAITTLFASISPCQCVCPNGSRKPFCLGITCGTRGCCCCGACCGSGQANGDGANVERTGVEATNQKCCCCCCRATAARDSATTAEHNHVQSKGCRLTLSQAQIATDSRRVAADNDSLPALLFREAPSRVLPISITIPVVWSYETYRPPPPPDFIVVFLHFVI
jgi:hypothetical protein